MRHVRTPKLITRNITGWLVSQKHVLKIDRPGHKTIHQVHSGPSRVYCWFILLFPFSWYVQLWMYIVVCVRYSANQENRRSRFKWHLHNNMGVYPDRVQGRSTGCWMTAQGIDTLHTLTTQFICYFMYSYRNSNTWNDNGASLVRSSQCVCVTRAL